MKKKGKGKWYKVHEIKYEGEEGAQETSKRSVVLLARATVLMGEAGWHCNKKIFICSLSFLFFPDQKVLETPLTNPSPLNAPCSEEQI